MTEPAETPELKRTRLLKKANTRLRQLSAHLVVLFGADDVAGVLLVQAISVMALQRDQTECARWLRELADAVESVGVEGFISKADLH